jgi:hypothetical protein
MRELSLGMTHPFIELRLSATSILISRFLTLAFSSGWWTDVSESSHWADFGDEAKINILNRRVGLRADGTEPHKRRQREPIGAPDRDPTLRVSLGTFARSGLCAHFISLLVCRCLSVSTE